MKKDNKILFGIGIISTFALLIAYTAQYGFSILPCHLCLYQRVPYFIVIGLSVVGILAPRGQLIFIHLCALAIAANACLAFYHVGVEQKWWASMFEGCKITFNDAQTLEQMMAAPSVPCDKPSWTDPIFGGSMAAYNVLFNIFLTSLYIYYTLSVRFNSIKK